MLVSNRIKSRIRVFSRSATAFMSAFLSASAALPAASRLNFFETISHDMG
jgi:hypothetical protein